MTENSKLQNCLPVLMVNVPALIHLSLWRTFLSHVTNDVLFSDRCCPSGSSVTVNVEFLAVQEGLHEVGRADSASY